MRRMLVALVCVLGPISHAAPASEFVEGEIETDLVPGPVAYGVLLPDGYEDAKSTFPLVLMLHGGNESHKELTG